MKDRQPFKLETIMMVYDLVQVVICFYISAQVNINEV